MEKNMKSIAILMAGVLVSGIALAQAPAKKDEKKAAPAAAPAKKEEAKPAAPAAKPAEKKDAAKK
jgi:hypothetical protein